MMVPICIPGKVFLAGEYRALLGQRALLLAVEPFFELSIADSGPGALRSGEIVGLLLDVFHPESPAGRFLRSDEAGSLRRQNPAVRWLDPYRQWGGGFGGSTAEFLAVTRLLCAMTGRPDYSLDQLMTHYFACISSPASGADLVAQALGLSSEVCVVRLPNGLCSQIESQPLQAPEGVGVIVTPVSQVDKMVQKLKTHEHWSASGDWRSRLLATPRQFLQTSGLSPALQIIQWSEITGSVLDLADLGLEAEHSKAFRLAHAFDPGVLVAKGCGARLHDVLLLAYSTAQYSVPDGIASSGVRVIWSSK